MNVRTGVFSCENHHTNLLPVVFIRWAFGSLMTPAPKGQREAGLSANSVVLAHRFGSGREKSNPLRAVDLPNIRLIPNVYVAAVPTPHSAM